jgi:3-dehydroquinate synthase
MKRVRVRLPLSPYDVLVGRDALHPRNLRPFFRKGAQGIVVSSKPVMALHGPRLRETLKTAGLDVRSVLTLEDGEKAKTVREWERAMRAMAAARLDRSSFVIGFGGGSVGDAAGFAAATYMRGIRVLQIPTTLLSMVDSSVGGKTGLNLVEGKNLVGSFHQPSLVVADLGFLRTLPERERQSGVYEILKCGFLRSEALVRLIERTNGLRDASQADLERAISAAVRIKAAIVEGDERESGERVLLNLGHTLGHALEAATCYRRFTHGEAVGYGMDFAADLGEALGITNAADARRIRSAVTKVGPRPPIKKSMVEATRATIQGDKKRVGSTLREVLIGRPGRTRTLELAVTSIERWAEEWLQTQTRRASHRHAQSIQTGF